MRDVIRGGRANIAIIRVPSCLAELLWPIAVTCCSPLKLVRYAKRHYADFAILGQPVGIEDGDAEMPEAVAQTESPGGSAQDTDAVATPEENAQDAK